MSIKSLLKTVTPLLGLLILGSSHAGWNEAGGEKDEAMVLTPDKERAIAVYDVCAACHLT